MDLRGPVWGTLALLAVYFVLGVAGQIPHMNGWQLALGLLGLWLFAPYVERRAGTLLFVVAYVFVALATGFLVGMVDSDSSYFAVSLFLPVLATAGAHIALAPRSKIICLLPIPFAMTFFEVPTIAAAIAWVALEMILTAA